MVISTPSDGPEPGLMSCERADWKAPVLVVAVLTPICASSVISFEKFVVVEVVFFDVELPRV
jgi:hypothetical protein